MLKAKACCGGSSPGWALWRNIIWGKNMPVLCAQPWLFRALLFAALGALLAWEVTSRTLAAYLANVAPEQAVVVRAHEPTALLSLADQKLGELIASGQIASGQSDPAVTGQIRAMAGAALLSDPFNARALRILGQLADLSRDQAHAWELMQASARHSMNEGPAIAWLVDKSFENKDYRTALQYTDVLLRARPQLISYVMPTLARIAEDEDASGELRKLLADNPPWRPQFFGALPNNVSDARTPLELLLAAKDSFSPPNADDLRGYLNFLIEHKFYALAYYAWLQFLPPEQLSSLGFLFNGGFETIPSGLPFDWAITPGNGVTMDIGPAPGGGRALAIAFRQGRVDFRGISQLLVLAPGKYQFSGRYTGEVMGQRGLKWRVTCAGGAAIGESAIVAGRASTWKSIDFDFAVPDADCPAQYLRLDLDARMSSERFVSGTIWFGELHLARGAESATP
jgi:hypothetical protein